MFRKKVRELPIPPEAMSAQHTAEVVRFWVADGTEHVSLALDLIQTNDQHHVAEVWGAMLADISRHVVNGLQQSGYEDSPETLHALIQRGFSECLKEKANISGQVFGDGNAH